MDLRCRSTLTDEFREDAATWVSLAEAADIIGCSIATVPSFVTEGCVVKRQGPRQQASINWGSAEWAGRVLAERREAKCLERRLRDG
jgi:phage terminase Nu1 subunit (DNA packaging protein)